MQDQGSFRSIEQHEGMLPYGFRQTCWSEVCTSVRADHQLHGLLASVCHLDHEDVLVGHLKLVALGNQLRHLLSQVVCESEVKALQPTCKPLLTGALVPEVGEVDPVLLRERHFPPVELDNVRAHQGEGLPQVFRDVQVVGALVLECRVRTCSSPIGQQRPLRLLGVERKALDPGRELEPRPCEASVRGHEAVIACSLRKDGVGVGRAPHQPPDLGVW
mmetsp:Transcript_145909/g.406419  ORF Transcript_145909/g.406419 Transcript_145909/m.406419 type:complete len:218 (-) Transcript_145909:318-971(-)